MIEFLKLEKVEIGGCKGRQLSSKITDIFTDFNQHFSSFAAKTYDVLDPDDSKFMQDFEVFQQRILELDVKLSAIFCSAFNDCHSLESAFKLINILGSVLDRPKIQQAFSDNYTNLLKMLEEELRCCEKIFAFQMNYLEEKGHLFVDGRFPNIISTLKWTKQLSIRISTPVIHFKALQHPISASSEAEELYRRYDELMRSLGELEDKTFSEWANEVPHKIETNLKKSLIGQAADKRLFLNYDKQLFALLREVYHLKVMGRENIPEEGLNFAGNYDMYRDLTLHLEKTIDWYNDVNYFSSYYFNGNIRLNYGFL